MDSSAADSTPPLNPSTRARGGRHSIVPERQTSRPQSHPMTRVIHDRRGSLCGMYFSLQRTARSFLPAYDHFISRAGLYPSATTTFQDNPET